MKAAIAIATIICGTALLITQRLRDNDNMIGGPSYCMWIGIALCIAGLVMAFVIFKCAAAPSAEKPIDT